MGEWPELRTGRLLLRGWAPEDRVALAAINADPRVMEFIGEPMTVELSDAMANRIEAKFEQQGFGLWAVEAPGVSPFIGFVGLNVPDFEAPFMPAVEIGWRLGVEFLGSRLRLGGRARRAGLRVRRRRARRDCRLHE